MPRVQLKFGRGIQAPAKLGTVILKPTSEGKFSYGQNVEVQNDEYGQSVLTPGPALNTLNGNSNLTGVPFIHAFYGSSIGYLWYAEGLLGATNIIGKIEDVLSGSIPQVDSSGILTVTHSAHSSVVVQDMVFRSPTAGTNDIVIVGKDANDQWIQRFTASASSPSLTGAQALSNSSADYEHHLLTAKDNKIYIAHANLIDSYSTDYAYDDAVLDIAPGYGISALAEWNNFMAIAASYDTPFTFNQRKQGSKSGIFLWNYVDPSFEKAPIVCPSRYISALVPEPDGNLLVFGGLDQGKTTLYEFTGYGYNVLYSYIGDMPRSHHSVDFDAEGRILWLTADGYLCRYDKRTGNFDQLSTISASSQYGGILSKLLNTAGYEFVVTSGQSNTPNNFYAKRVSFGNYIGDGDSEDIVTPLAVSGLVNLPKNSIITDVEIHCQKAMQSGDKLEIRLYKNGSASYTTLGTMSFASDGTVATKHIRSVQYNADNACVGIAWKMTDNNTSAPGIIDAYLHYNTINTL